MQQGDVAAPPRTRLVVAIDGPSGSGKSTVARGVARALGYRYLDTGAMYRAVTWLALERGVALDDAAALTGLAGRADLELSTDPDGVSVRVDGVDVTAAIRSGPVTAAVSAVSAVPGVRAEMVSRQRAILAEGGVVAEGRDIGTTVAPDAAVKIFLTADPEARARRRGEEIAGTTAIDAAHVAATEQALRQRDTADATRAASPLTQAADASVLDSTHLDAEQVIAAVLAQVRRVTDGAAR